MALASGERQHIMGGVVHETAAQGFERHAETYARARPGYHPAVVDRFMARWGRGAVAELGAGTGIFTRQLHEAGARVIAVEPVAAMRQVLVAQLPEVAALAATAERIPLATGAVSTVVAAQSFHWFDQPAALDEINRVLRPGGHLVTVWNTRDTEVGWVADYVAAIDRHAGDTPRHATMHWRRAIDADSRLELVDDWAIANPRPLTSAGAVERAVSISFIAAMPLDRQRLVREEVRAIVEPFGPDLEFPYRCEIQAWRQVRTS